VSSTTVLAVGTSTEGVKAETTFILTLANGKSPGVNEYHQQVQKYPSSSLKTQMA
jgi:hypothetical protein